MKYVDERGDALRGESDRDKLLKEWFEQISSTGVQCKKCGCTVQPAGALRERHIEWHQELEARLDGR